MKSLTVVFVCYGNIHRSVIAEECLKQLVAAAGLNDQIHVYSRGIQGFGGVEGTKFPNLRHYKEIWAAAEDALAEVGVSVEGHEATPISEADVQGADLVIAMEDKIYSRGEVNLLDSFGEYHGKIRRFNDFEGLESGVPDLGDNTDPKAHREVALRIQAGAKIIFNHLLQDISE